MQSDSHGDHVAILIRFNRLIRSIIDNKRSSIVYKPWEVQLLVDISDCINARRTPKKTFDEYLRAARRQIEETGQTPILLSVYLNSRRRRVSRPTHEVLP